MPSKTSKAHFLRCHRVDAPHPDAAAQDRFVYWQPHSGGHFDEMKWIGPGAYTEAPIASNEEPKGKEQSDFLEQIARIEELANLAEEDTQSRARIAQEGKRKKKQRKRKCKTMFTSKKALKRAWEQLRKYPTEANLQAVQEGLGEAAAPKKSRPLPRNDNPIEEVLESPFHTAYEHLSVPENATKAQIKKSIQAQTPAVPSR